MKEMNDKILDENDLNNNNNNNNINDNNIEEEEEFEKDETYENLLNSKFKQQQLLCWRPKPTLLSSSKTYFFFGLVLIIFGICLFFFEPYENKTRYDDKCKNQNTCTVNFTLSKTLKKGHILVSYELHGFNQNHRMFINSKSEDQLKGKNSTDGCGDLKTNEEMNVIYNYNKTKKLEPKDIAIPCGLYAKNFFNDTFKLFKNDDENKEIFINQNGIAWDNDKDKFKNVEFPDGWENHQWFDMTNEHFIVWMRPAFMNDFRKLWGKIDEELEKGEYYFEIENNYNVSDDIKKYIIISKINVFGSKNTFMIVTSLLIGTFCVGIASYLYYLSRKADKKKII